MNAIYNSLKPVDFIIVAIYLIILVAIGYWVSFVKKKSSNENLFLAERSLGWGSIGFTMWGTNVGPSMLVLVILPALWPVILPGMPLYLF